MTRRRLIALAESRALLLQRAAAERDAVQGFLGRADAAASLVARVRSLIDELLRRPLLVAAGAAFLVALRPRRALGWLAKGWSLWRVYRGAQRWWTGVAGRAGASA